MKKRTFKKILSAALAVLLIGGVIFGAVKIFGNDTKSISSTAFSVGAIGADGEYTKNEQALYTKKMFECKGLTVELDYESNTKYKIFYYNFDGNFISDSGPTLLDKSFNEEVPAAAKYARIMLIPEPPEGETKSSFSINFFEKYVFANDIKIRVDKDQAMTNLFEADKVDMRAQIDVSNDELVYVEAEDICCSKPIELSGHKELKVLNNSEGDVRCYLVDSENKATEVVVLAGSEDVLSVESYVDGTLVVVYDSNYEAPVVYPYK